MTCGSRMDLAVAVARRLKIDATGFSQFHVSITSGPTQRLNNMTEFLMYALQIDKKGAHSTVPASIAALLARALKGEQTRLRCTCRDWPSPRGRGH